MRLGRLNAALAAACIFAGCATVPTESTVDQDRGRDLIHSDVPLLASGSDDYWPRSFTEGADFGCESRVAFGDWVLRESDGSDHDDPIWYSVRNYGAFHCFAQIGTASERSELAGADVRPSFFVRLGTERSRNATLELWAMQIGARPGSDYVLLSREPTEGTIRSFSVLQRKCPAAQFRTSGPLGILRTDYCSINSREDLRRLARRMLDLAPLGTMSVVPPQPEQAP